MTPDPQAQPETPEMVPRERMDSAYRERDRCVAGLARMALDLGYLAWLSKHPERDDGWDPEWTNIVFVHLPTGQMSWHVHDSELPLFDFLKFEPSLYDGHSTDEKYHRLYSYTHRHLGLQGGR